MKYSLWQHPLLLIYQSRHRRQRKWAWLVGIALGLLQAAAALLTGLQREYPTAWMDMAAALALGVFLLCQIGFAAWSCSSTLLSLVQGGAYNELALSGIDANQLMDIGVVHFARRWLGLTPMLLAVAALTGSFTTVLAVLVGWIALLLLGICSVYFKYLTHLAFMGLVAWRGLVAWGMMSYFGMIAITMISTNAWTPRGCVLPMVGMATLWTVYSAWLARRTAAIALLDSLAGQRSVAIARGSGGWWNWTASSNPLLYRFVMTRPNWKGRPVWLWVSGVLGGIGFLVALASPPAGLGFIFEFVALHGMFFTMSHLSFLYRENQKKTMEGLLGAMTPTDLVTGLEQVGSLSRLPEILILVIPGCLGAAISCLAQGLFQELLIGVPVTLGVGALIAILYRLSSRINVTFALEARRRSLAPMLWFLAPMLTYFCFLAAWMLSGVTLAIVGGIAKIALSACSLAEIFDQAAEVLAFPMLFLVLAFTLKVLGTGAHRRSVGLARKA